MRNRSVVFVIRDKKILMEKLCYEGRTFYSIPGVESKMMKLPNRLQSGKVYWKDEDGNEKELKVPEDFLAENKIEEGSVWEWR